MHILFLTHYFPPEVNAPATRTYEHCRRWVEAGHQVTVITCAPNCPNGVVFDGYKNRLSQLEYVDGIKVVRVWTHIAANKGFLRRIANFLSYMVLATLYALTVRKVDVVVATSPQFFCGWAGVFCHWIRRWPFVLEIRDIWPESILSVGAMKPSLFIRMLEWCERRMYAAANHIVTVGEGYRSKLLERGVPDDKISVITNGVDLHSFQPVARDNVQEPEAFVCTYVGTIGMAHGLDVILKAAERARANGQRPIKFRIVGDGAERARLEAEVAARQLTNIEFLGLVPKDQVPSLIAESNACLVHLKGTELFSTVIPSKIFEMMAMNVPIIMGVCGQAREIVLVGNAGIAMTPDDPDSLLDCIEEIHQAPGRYSNGRAHVRQNFSRDMLAAEMLRVIQVISGLENNTANNWPSREAERPANAA